MNGVPVPSEEGICACDEFPAPLDSLPASPPRPQVKLVFVEDQAVVETVFFLTSRTRAAAALHACFWWTGVGPAGRFWICWRCCA